MERSNIVKKNYYFQLAGGTTSEQNAQVHPLKVARKLSFLLFRKLKKIVAIDLHANLN
jgi:hypothetical protein